MKIVFLKLITKGVGMDVLFLFPALETHTNKLKNAYEVSEDFSIEFESRMIYVPKYFQFDGASIPRAAYPIIGTPFNPKFMHASVVHDWLYHTHEIERSDANSLFYKMLIDCGVGNIRASSMLKAVKIFGGWYWENDDDDMGYIDYLKLKISNDGKDPAKYGLK